MNLRWMAFGGIIGSIPGLINGNQIMVGWCAFAVLIFLFSFIPMSRGERARITLECLDELKKESEKATRERAEANEATTIKIKE